MVAIDHRFEKGFWAKDHQSIHYLLIPPAQKSYETLFSLCNKASLSYFHPANAQFGRMIHQLKDYFVVNIGEDGDGYVNPIDLLPSTVKTFCLYAYGKIEFQIDESTKRLIKVQIPFNEYELSYGDERIENINKGFLFSSINKKIWFNLDRPIPIYLQHDLKIKTFLDPHCLLLTQFNKRNRYYGYPHRTLSSTRIVDAWGKVIRDGILPVTKNSSSIGVEGVDVVQPFYAVSGTIFKSTVDEIVPIRTFVTDYRFDMSNTERDPVSLMLLSVNQVLYKVRNTENADIQPFNCLLNDYNWPSDDSQVWRRIKEYTLSDDSGNLWPMTKNDFEDGHVVLRGKLIAPPESGPLPDISIQTYLERYSIDFGMSIDDENKGLWLSDIHGDWYKVTAPPAREYEAMAEKSLKQCKKFLEFHDTLKYHESPKFLGDQDEEGGFFCDYAINDIYKLSNAAFDIDFICENKDFVRDNVFNVVSKDSKRFYGSLRNLTGIFTIPN